MSTHNDGEPLRIELASVAGATYRAGYAPFAITFRNVGLKTLRVLRQFEPLVVFFWFEMAREDGTPLLMPGGGKVDLVSANLSYITLAAGESFELAVDIHPLLPRPFTPGLYAVRVTYHNQYGDDCFKGQAISPIINVPFEGPAV